MRTIIIHVRNILAWSVLLFATPVLAAHEYTITVDAALANMTVTARFDRDVEYVSARASDAGRYLRAAQDCDSGAELAARGRRLLLPAGGIRCLNYEVSLRAANRDDAKIVISPSLWMWRPRLARDDAILVTFSLRDGNAVFVPWQMRDASGLRYRLVASPESGTATAIFGKFEQRFLPVADATLRIVSLGAEDAIELDDFLDWLRSTAANIELLYGRFPNPAASVILLPAASRGRGSDRAVGFGRVVRDGGEVVELTINPASPIAAFYEAWTPTHEFSHLLLPYLKSEQRWISEGFAQYYQNVLLARAGQQSELDAWQKIYAGLERGRESAPGMSPNQAADRGRGDTRMKVYWSGAALALMADVEIRRRSDGKKSLDTLLGELQDCCLPSARSWSGVEFCNKLDELLGAALFVPLYRQYADASGFPDFGPLLAELGVHVDSGQVRLDATATLAALRYGITQVATTH